MYRVNAVLISLVCVVPIWAQNQAWWVPEVPNPGDSVTIYYNTRYGMLSESSDSINLHWGINGWHEPPEDLWPPGSWAWGDGAAIESPMTQLDDTIWNIKLATDESVTQIDFCFHNNLNEWDNNSGRDWHIYMGTPPAIVAVRFVLDTRSCNLPYIGGEVTQVNLAGNFNGWVPNDPSMAMTQTDNPYVWEKIVNLYEGTYEYKFVVNRYVWVTDPDNPVYVGEFQNAVIVVTKELHPRVYVDSPPYCAVLYDVDTVNIFARVRTNDDGVPIDESSIIVTVDDSVIPHVFDTDSLVLTANVSNLGYGVHVISISLADTAGNHGYVSSVFGMYPSGSGYHAVDAVCDEHYTYPVGVEDGSCDLIALHISESGDSLRFSIHIRDITDYTKLGIQIASDAVGPMVELPQALEVKTHEWNGTGVFFTIVDPNSQLCDTAVDNHLYTQRYPPVVGDPIPVAVVDDSFVFELDLGALETILGSYNVPWYFYVFTWVAGFEPDSEVGGSVHFIDPDIYDVMFFESDELQHKLLRNYIPAGRLGGPRMVSLDAIGRGIATISAYEIDSSLYNPGPVVRLLTRSGEVYDSIYTVDGTISDTTIHSAILTVNEEDTTIPVVGGCFSVQVKLSEGDNIISCRAQNSAGYWGYSPCINLHLYVDHTPKAIIDTVYVDGNRIWVDGSTSYDPDSDPLTYLWYADTTNPAPIEFDDPNAAITWFVVPPTDGEYYFTLKVTDPDGNTDFARRFIRVKDGAISVATTDSIAEWIRDAIIYEIFVQSFSEEGNFNAVRARIPELKDLGINCIWFMPINPSAYTNGYSVLDYYGIRPDYGTEEELRELLATCKTYGIRVIIDHVINHCSNQHPWMIDAQSYGEYSHFYDYFMWDEYGNYQWTAGADLPDLNFNNPHLKSYLLDMAEYWVTEFDIDGYRCDLAWAVEGRDSTYWRTWRERVKSKRPDALLLAEAPAADFRYFRHRFDLAYDWNLHHAAPVNFVNIFDGGVTGDEIDALHQVITNYGYGFPKDRFPLRFLENHDETRYIAYHTVEQTKLMAALLFTIPGVPLIYAGQEVGELTLRDKIDWSDPYNLRPYYKRLCWIRNTFPALRTDEIVRINTTSPTVYAFLRKADDNIIICGFNFYEGGNYVVLQIPIDSLGISPDSTYYMNDVLHNEYVDTTGAGLANFGVYFRGYEPKIYVLADSIIVGMEELPHVGVNRLYQNFPNPFNGATTIRYQVAAAYGKKLRVSLKLYDITGRLVRTLVDDNKPAGTYTVVWDGTDERGRKLSAGVYFCKLKVGGFSDIKKLVLVK